MNEFRRSLTLIEGFKIVAVLMELCEVFLAGFRAIEPCVG
jgi:hypothetical protein